jgi:hypothetical protein
MGSERAFLKTPLHEAPSAGESVDNGDGCFIRLRRWSGGREFRFR